nr:MAG TPA_asm: hypothetical protein [Caudoviricetes sp.]
MQTARSPMHSMHHISKKMPSSSIAAYSSLLPFEFNTPNNPNNPENVDTQSMRGYYNSIKTTQRAGGWIAGMQ